MFENNLSLLKIEIVLSSFTHSSFVTNCSVWIEFDLKNVFIKKFLKSNLSLSSHEYFSAYSSQSFLIGSNS